MRQFASGEEVGNGAAINVELGWIPDCVIVTNVTDSDKITIGFPNREAIPFTSGGTTEIKAGDVIVGATSGATATVAKVLLYSGSWSGGDAAGFFIIERDSLTGTFQSENVDVGSNSNLATVSANVTHSVDVDTEVAAATTNAAITGYTGSAASNAKGFTIGSTVAEEAKLLRWAAWRNG